MTKTPTNESINAPTKPAGPGRPQWRSLEARAGSEATRAIAAGEFLPGAFEVDLAKDGDVSRRSFLGVMGASMALAGTTLAGCMRRPVEHILPYTKRPEDLIPGAPQYYATSAWIGGSVHPLLVESHEGRPTKVEGNPQHPASAGATSAWAQATVLGLYDPDRSKVPATGGKDSTWEAVRAAVAERFTAARVENGNGVAILVEAVPSPTRWRMLAALSRTLPQAAVYGWSPAAPGNAEAGLGLVGATGHGASADLSKATVVLAVDDDVLGSGPYAIRNARAFASRRRVDTPAGEMNRLYAIEGNFTVTGAMADHRLRVRGSRVGEALIAVARALAASGVALSAGGLEPRGADEKVTKWATAAAKDLASARGKAVVLVGERQPAWVHALGHAINEALGAFGSVVTWHRSEAPQLRSITELAQAIDGALVKTLVIVGGNPAYDAPADLKFAELLPKVPFSLHLGLYRDETAQRSLWHVPESHYLEAWGDLVTPDRVASIQQPLIAPLYDTLSDIELLALLGEPQAAEPRRGYDLVRETWATAIPAMAGSEKAWNRWLHDGVIDAPTAPAGAPAFSWGGLTAALGARPAPAEGTEVAFVVDPSVYDGRYANLSWLQELPDPISKLTWDNAAIMGAALARKLGVEFDTESGGNQERPMVQVTVDGRSLTLGVFVVPGIADDTVVLPLGYGRKGLGRVAEGVGFDTYTLRGTSSLFYAAATVAKASGGYRLASTQDHGSMEGRPIVREATLDEFRQEPAFVEKYEVMPADKITSLWDPPWDTAYRGQKPLHKWGMVVDLNVCTGCSACTVACQAENNIPVVGKEQILKGREMHWIRLDRYFVGDNEDEPEAVVQPMMCQQCENAPCESVCPVAATAHSPEGLNDMAYNRCIGTRYCANNCPFKVRRFNFHNFNIHIGEVEKMQKNPDVTVRFRGVMEKCTFCVQRIQEAKIAAKRDGNGIVPDGAVVPACAQTCPTNAITFGDLQDPNSAVSKARAQVRNYAVLAELNLYTRNTYLAKLRNPNPELV